jgi:hypothetical protein
MVTSQTYNVLRQWEWHAGRQLNCIENKGLVSSEERLTCVEENTPWPSGRTLAAGVWPREQSELL